MKKRVTLTIDDGLLLKAKRYVTMRQTSVSALVEGYLKVSLNPQNEKALSI